MIGLAVAIAAGGDSRRFGRPKASALLGGAPLLSYSIKFAYEVSDSVYLLLRDRNQISNLGISETPVIMYDCRSDSIASRIASSLRRIPEELIFLMGCDMPFLDTRLPGILVSKIGSHGVAVPAWSNGFIEPMAAVYSKSRLPGGSSAKRIKSMRDLIAGCDPIFVSIENEGIPPASFFNINSPEDLMRAESALHSLAISTKFV